MRIGYHNVTKKGARHSVFMIVALLVLLMFNVFFVTACKKDDKVPADANVEDETGGDMDNNQQSEETITKVLEEMPDAILRELSEQYVKLVEDISTNVDSSSEQLEKTGTLTQIAHDATLNIQYAAANLQLFSEYTDIVLEYLERTGFGPSAAQQAVIDELFSVVNLMKDYITDATGLLQSTRGNTDKTSELKTTTTDFTASLKDADKKLKEGTLAKYLTEGEADEIKVTLTNKELGIIVNDMEVLRKCYGMDLSDVYILNNNGMYKESVPLNINAETYAAKLEGAGKYGVEYIDQVLSRFELTASQKSFIGEFKVLYKYMVEYGSDQFKVYDPSQSSNSASLKTATTQSGPTLYRAERDWNTRVESYAQEYYAVKSIKSVGADAFPGKVGDNVEKVTNYPVVVQLENYSNSHLKNSYGDNTNLYIETGLYALPGETVIIDIPEGTDVSTLQVQIGVHSDLVSGTAPSDMRRYTNMIVRNTLRVGRNEISSPHGGYIVLLKTKLSDPVTAEIKISNAVKGIVFELGKTTQEEWDNTIKNYSLPYGVIIGERIVAVLPMSVTGKDSGYAGQKLGLSTTKDMVDLVKSYDEMIYNIEEMSGLSLDAPLPHRGVLKKQKLVLDTHISAGAMHSGYPVMATSADRYIKWATTPDDMRNLNSWPYYHEFGHNYQQYAYKWPRVVEVTNNIYGMYGLEMNGDYFSRFKSTTGGVTYEELALRFIADENPEKDYDELDYFPELFMFMQLRYAYGWDFYIELQKYTRETDTSNALSSATNYNQNRLDNLVEYACTITGHDLREFFDKWGLKYTPAVSDRVAAKNLPKPDVEVWNLTAPLEMDGMIVVSDSFTNGKDQSPVSYWNTTDGYRTDTLTEAAPRQEEEYVSTDSVWYSTATWSDNRVFKNPASTDTVTIEFDITILKKDRDTCIGFTDSSTSITYYTQMAVMLRAKGGTFDSRNGGNFASTTSLKYTIGTVYHAKIVVNLAAKKYDIFMTTANGSTIQLAKDFAYRDTAAAPVNIGRLAIFDSSEGAAKIENLTLNGEAVQTPVDNKTSGTSTGSYQKPSRDANTTVFYEDFGKAAGSTSNVCMVLKTISSKPEVFAKRDFAAKAGEISVKFSVNIKNQSNTSVIELLDSSSGVSIGLSIKNGKLYEGENALADINVNTWYSIEVKTSKDMKTMSILVNGTAVKSNVAVTNTIKDIAALQFKTNGELWVDNVTVRKYPNA